MILAGCLIMGVLANSATEQVPLPKLTIPDGFGVNIHFTNEPRDLDLIAEAGFKFIRMDLGWGGVEREKGVYNFGGHDALTEGCLKRGIRIIYIVDYSNKLYESDMSVRTAEGREAFAAFAETAAKRYAGQGMLWEIWNEPNLKQFWRPQPSIEDYCALVEATVPRIRAADPSGIILAPTTSGIPFDWLEECFKKGLLEWIDALSVHPYRSHPPEDVLKDYAQLRELMGKYLPEGKEMPVISGEWGYSQINWDKSNLPEEQQGQYLVRMFLINLMEGVPISIWYDWKDDGTDPDEREHHFGTMTHDLNTKPAYLAAKTLAHTLGGYSFVQRIDLESEQDFALELARGQSKAIAFWTTGEEHEITIPMGGNDTLKVNMLHSPQYLVTD